MAIQPIDGSFTILPGKEIVRTKNYWFKLRIRRALLKRDYYIDVLIGERDKTKPHSHIGINMDQTLRFAKPRSHSITIRREVDSKFKGRVSDETVRIGDSKGTGRVTFTWRVLIDGPTRTITVLFDEISGKEPT